MCLTVSEERIWGGVWGYVQVMGGGEGLELGLIYKIKKKSCFIFLKNKIKETKNKIQTLKQKP